MALLVLQDVDNQLAQADSNADKISVYESLMKELIDAQQALRDELKDDAVRARFQISHSFQSQASLHDCRLYYLKVYKSMQRGQAIEGRVPNHIFLHSYLSYLRQTKTAERNLLMIESLKENLPGRRQDERQKITRPQDLVRLFDIIIQVRATKHAANAFHYCSVCPIYLYAELL